MPPRRRPPWHDLPTPLVQQVLSAPALDARDVVRASAACRNWAQAAREPGAWAHLVLTAPSQGSGQGVYRPLARHFIAACAHLDGEHQAVRRELLVAIATYLGKYWARGARGVSRGLITHLSTMPRRQTI